MKKRLLFIFALFIVGFGYAQTTATDFTANDCSGISYNLFTELNSGKVIVIVWVMPCASCISPSRNAYDVVQTYATSNPGRVVYYMADDYANTSCNTLTSWGNSNSMPNSIKFSNSQVDPSDYGNVGMPKIVVLGGINHTVFYNEDDGANPGGLKPAIDQALLASGIEEAGTMFSDIKLVPNTFESRTTLHYNLLKGNTVSIGIYDITGKLLKNTNIENQFQGKHEVTLDFDNFTKGMFFLKISSNGLSKVVKFVITQ